MADFDSSEPAAAGWLPGAVIKRRDVECWLDAEIVRRNALAFHAAAVAEAAAILDRESRRGFAEGIEAGRRQGMADADVALAQLADEVSRRLAAVEETLISVVSDCVGEIIGAMEPHEQLRRVVCHALSGLAGTKGLTLVAAPDLQLELLRRLALDHAAAGGEPVPVVVDPALPKAELRLTGDDGTVNITVDAQLKALRRNLEESWAAGSPA